MMSTVDFSISDSNSFVPYTHFQPLHISLQIIQVAYKGMHIFGDRKKWRFIEKFDEQKCVCSLLV